MRHLGKMDWRLPGSLVGESQLRIPKLELRDHILQ